MPELAFPGVTSWPIDLQTRLADLPGCANTADELGNLHAATEFAATSDGSLLLTVPETADETAVRACVAQAVIAAEPTPPPLSIPEMVGAALHQLNPATATVAQVLAVLAPIFPAPPS